MNPEVCRHASRYRQLGCPRSALMHEESCVSRPGVKRKGARVAKHREACFARLRAASRLFVFSSFRCLVGLEKKRR